MLQETRRLAAVMFTDMVGYTLLSQRDERKAMALLDEQRKIVRNQVEKHEGREVKTIGDAFLVEFTSALKAVNCAAAIQESVHKVNERRGPEDKIVLRVGIHLGEVLESGNDLLGDAVNVASRIQSLASPGGICLSKQVYENVSNKSAYRFESLGRRELKNVPVPVELYRLVMSWEKGKAKSAEGTLPADRVAVLPFVSMSPDPNDEYFADGLTEELISKLSQVRGLRVIARTSVMNYKKKEKNASEIGTELGVGTLVEGSVRKAGDKIRVTVQVVDSNTEEHRWSSNYDRNLDDVFAVQADIAARVTESLPGTVVTAPRRAEAGETTNVESYTAFLKGRELVQQPTKENVKKAMELFKRAVELDPYFARGYVELADCYAELRMEGLMAREESRRMAYETLEKALEINPDLAEGHAEKGLFAWYDDDFAIAEAEDRKAIELNPNLAEPYENLSLLKVSMGSLAEGVRMAEKAYELNPLSTLVPLLGTFYLYQGREEEALKLWDKTEKVHPMMTDTSRQEYHFIRGELEKAMDFQKKLEKTAPDSVGIIASRG
ncbi:MAG TPA: adenylate/guanylate cyclase domain-containing protein, partial [Nitrososphaerales archaeon]|nr:adenylate/guanylate cyclase domain-containing protein [Nitrososphaerales archaeon]